jgi:hypothetical protein
MMTLGVALILVAVLLTAPEWLTEIWRRERCRRDARNRFAGKHVSADRSPIDSVNPSGKGRLTRLPAPASVRYAAPRGGTAA